MKFQTHFNYFPVVLFVLLVLPMILSNVEARTSKPAEEITGKKPHPTHCNRENNSDKCSSPIAKKPPRKQCNRENNSVKCSPPVAHRIKATLTINDFEKGGDGGGPSACDGKFHSNNIPIVALPTGWFKNKQRCHKNIRIFGNGREVTAMVVDECVCRNNLLDASKAVWKALGVPQKDWGELDVYWSDA